jgi:hypothetical protein
MAITKCSIQAAVVQKVWSRLFGNRWLPQNDVCRLRQKFRRSSAAVATT